MFYLIGIGLERFDLNLKALRILKKCKEIFIDNYTTYLPFSLKDYEKWLQKILKRKIKLNEARRDLLEEKSKEFLRKAKKINLALLVYGDPLIATTHLALIKEARKLNIKTKVIHNCSILNAISQTGLSIYKFGKITSLPKWQKRYKPKSFYEIIKSNLSINAHTLLLVDIELELNEALKQLEESDRDNLLKTKEIFVCSTLGTREERIERGKLKELKLKKIRKPFCFIIPANLEFYEN